jgi:hypothetical protein
MIRVIFVPSCILSHALLNLNTVSKFIGYVLIHYASLMYQVLLTQLLSSGTTKVTNSPKVCKVQTLSIGIIVNSLNFYATSVHDMIKLSC